MLEDIAILTGGKALTEDLGIKLENIKLDDLGKAKQADVDNDNTTIDENAGLEGSVVVEKVKSDATPTRGFDAETMEYVDMLQAGIIDPTKVERVALQNAASVASLLLTTEALITDLPEEKKEAPPMPHGDF